MSSEFVKRLLEEHPPGSYFFRGLDVEGVTAVYFRADKEHFLRMLSHDYAVAVLRRDEAVRKRVSEAYRVLASWLDWPEPPWLSLERSVVEAGGGLSASRSAVKEITEATVETAFKSYEEKIRVDGWRIKEDETVYDGERRGLLLDEESEEANLFWSEVQRWSDFETALYRLMWDEDLRLRDRTTLWFVLKLQRRVRGFMYGLECTSLNSPWANYVLDSIIEDRFEFWSDLALNYVEAAFLQIEDTTRIQAPGPFLAEDVAAMAVMAACEVWPQPLKTRDFILNNLKDRELADLYDLAIRGPPEYKITTSLELLWKPFEELPEEQRRSLKRMREASNDFIAYMLEYAADIIKERRQRVKRGELKTFREGELAPGQRPT